MRISDWSSDVCSSDLPRCVSAPANATRTRFNRSHFTKTRQPPARRTISQEGSMDDGYEAQGYHRADQGKRHRVGRPARSEEHTSELQSLMRISYAVFCLKKKKKNKNNITTRSKSNYK